MPLPDWMTPETEAKPPKKKLQTKPELSNQTTSPSAPTTTKSTGAPPADFTLGARPSEAMAERMFETLDAKPLPTQGYVADLVARITLPEPGDKPVATHELANLFSGDMVKDVPDPKKDRLAEQMFGEGESKTPLVTGAPRRPLAETYKDVTIDQLTDAQLEWIRKENEVNPFRELGKGQPQDDYSVQISWGLDHGEEVAEELRRRMLQAKPERAERGNGKPVPHGPVERMSWDEFQALNPQQQAAVKFNTLLVQAVRRDRKMRRTGAYDDVTPEQLQKYGLAEANVFGENGSKKYAPETLAVLQQINLQNFDDLGIETDFDDFLQLRTAITEDDLKHLRPGKLEKVANLGLGWAPDAGKPTTELVPADYSALEGTAETRVVMGDVLATGTAELEEELAKANILLDNWKKTAYIDPNRQAGLQDWGATPRQLQLGMGFGTPTFDRPGGNPTNYDAYFQTVFDKMANAEDDLGVQARLGLAAEALTEPGVLQEFYNYIDLRSRNAAEHGLSLGTDENIKYRSPEEFRKLLGLE